MNAPAQANKGRRQLTMLIVLFLLPPIAAWLAWQYLGQEGVGSTTNAGTLIRPARPIDMDRLAESGGLEIADFQGRWLYVVYASDGCEDRCQQQLYLTRQVRIAVNKDTQRVRRMLVLNEPAEPALQARLEQEHPDLLIASGAAGAMADSFSGDRFGISGEQYFLVDPLGNLMMFYGQDVTPKGILRDLQKLLKISQVG